MNVQACFPAKGSGFCFKQNKCFPGGGTLYIEKL